MLPSISSREALLACPPCPPWNLPSFTVESTLSSPCSRSDPPFFAKMRLSPTLTLSPLMIWYSGQTALFFFRLANAAPAYLPTALSVALRPLFPFQQAQFFQVFLLKPAPFCMLFAASELAFRSPTNSSICPSLRFFVTTSVPLPSIFRKLAGMTLPSTLTLTVLLQRNTRLFLFPLLLRSLPLWH